MIFRRKGAREYIVRCPACRGRLRAGWKTCPRCGHGEASWNLIARVLRLPGTRDLGYTQGTNSTNEGGP